MNKPKFSVCLIARNEEVTLPRMVGSLKEFQTRGGEIWVLDTGSTDKTIEVAKSLGCKVEVVGDRFRIKIDKELSDKINTKFVVDGELPVVKDGDSLFDFASARNYIANFASNDMIATPDCDEIFTKFDIDKLDEVITNGAEQLEYEFVFSHDWQGNPLIKFRHCKFYNRKKAKWVGVIHEILQGTAQMQYLGEDIIKLEHYQNEKTNRTGYLKGLAIDCYNNPDNDRNSHYFAREMYYNGGRYKSAIKEFLNHISMGRWGTEAAQSMLHIGDCYKELKNYDEMLKWYIKSVEKEARREPLMRLAEYYFSKNMHAQVILYAEAALTITQLPFYSNHQPYYENVPHELLYISYWWVGKKDKSEEHYKKALAFCPKNPRYISDGKFYNIPTRLDIYTKKIKNDYNFTFIKRGDGELACMNGEVGVNCDGHNYSKELGDKLRESFDFLKDKADIVEWNDQVNYNILLHRKDNDLEKLKTFWMTIQESPRRKFFVGPRRLRDVCIMLDAELIEVPLVNSFDYIKANPLFKPPENNDIYIFSCGMPAKVEIANLIRRNPNITCIDAGSSFDPIFIGNTRTEQETKEKLEELYNIYLYKSPIADGMVTNKETNWLYGTAREVRTFLEIGSYKGKSTHAILSSGCPTVYAVDHFVGSSDPIETGNLDTYDAFMKNVGHFPNLIVKKMSSLEAVKDFADKSLDVVFIDGGHRIQEITEDIVAWLPKTKKILCGHDYHDVKAVKLAVDTLLGPVQVCDRIWYKVLDGTEKLDMDKANKLARYLDMDFVNKMFALSQIGHPESEYVVEQMDDIEGQVVYDMGCGNHKTFSDAIGVDINPGADIRASIDDLPMIKTNSVDTIISRHSLEHIADTEKTLTEWSRILKDNGKIVFILPDDEFINTLDPVLSGGVHLQAFTRDSFKEALKKVTSLILKKIETVVESWSFGGVIKKVPLPKITFVIPTLGREEGLKRCLDSIDNLNYPKDKIEVIVKHDSYENRTGVPKLLKQGVEESAGEWIVFASNDCEFTPDSIREALVVGEDGYASFNTGPLYSDEGNINEHFMIRKDIIEKIGEVFDTDFYHCGCDNLLWAKMKKLGIAKRADRAILNHHHWTKTKDRTMDKTYKLGWSHVEEDRVLLKKKLAEL